MNSKPQQPINIFLVSCSKEKKSGNDEQRRMISQITTLIKSINFFTSRHINIYLITNMVWVFRDVKKEVEDLEDLRNIK